MCHFFRDQVDLAKQTVSKCKQLAFLININDYQSDTRY